MKNYCGLYNEFMHDFGDWIIGIAYPTCIILLVQVLGNFIHGRHMEN